MNITLALLTLLCWVVLFLMTIRKPQRFRNAVMLMITICVTLPFVAALFGSRSGIIMLIITIGWFLFIMIVPFAFIANGIIMITKESLCLAHLLSLLMGVVIGLGEFAGVFSLLGAFDAKYFKDIDMYLFPLSMTVLFFSLMLLSFMLYSVFINQIPHRYDFDYVIIHGCGLAEGYRVTKLLQNRIDKAIDIYNRCKIKPHIIASGGQGSDEKLSEAQAITNYLLEHNIPEEDIILEDRSTTTWENLLYSKELIEARGAGNKIALVSNNYHIYRCLCYAKKLGMNCVGIGGGVAFYYWPTALIREFIALFKQKRFVFWTLLCYIFFMLCNSVFLFYLA